MEYLESTRYLAETIKLLRTVGLLLFDSFHPPSMAVTTPSGRHQLRCPPKDVMRKVTASLLSVMGEGIYLHTDPLYVY